jgi:hypothetical protein
MKISVLILTAAVGAAVQARAVEEAEFKVVERDGRFEVRDYAPQILAETIVEQSMEDAGNAAFRRLFKYISGENSQTNKIAMTAPVGQERAGEKIAMTAPVSQQAEGDRWAVSFMMPQSYTMQSIPRPTNAQIRLREVPARRVAAIRYSGFWSESRYAKHLEQLRAWMEQKGLAPAGDPVWARYNPPFTPWFMRRNEVLIPLETKP